MSDHDEWMMKATGVNLSALRAGTLAQPLINPLSISILPPIASPPSASAPPPATPAKPAPPPKEALARAGDSRPFWRPAPADASDKPAVSRSWLDDFLRFYRAGPPSPADSKGATYSFNGSVVTLDAALDVVDAQVALNGYKPDRSTARGLLQDLLKEGAENAERSATGRQGPEREEGRHHRRRRQASRRCPWPGCSIRSTE